MSRSETGGTTGGRIWAIAAKDLTAIGRNRALLGPMVIIPLLFVTLFPVMVYGLAIAEPADVPNIPIADLVSDDALDGLPAAPGPRLAYILSLYLLPTVLVLVPLIVVSAIATDAVAGERERNTLEGLLVTPATDIEVFIGKLLAALIPGLVVHTGASILYAVGIDLALSPVSDGPVLPNGPWLWIVLWFGPAFTTALVAFAIVVSARARSVQGASQLTSVAVLPHLVAIVTQAGGIGLLGGWVVFAAGLLLWLAAVAMVIVGARSLQRGRLTLALS